ncbi:MAG: hypothetical protein K2N16_06635, partial [Muribaculaceae bacterium]|nr:hypothetical protein [Muribaculaceae bacterium]
MNNVSNNKKNSHALRNAAIVGGAVLGGAASAAAAATPFLASDEILPEVEEDVEVDYIDAEPEEMEAEVEQDVAVSYGNAHYNAPVQHEADPIVNDVNEVALSIDEEDPFDAVVIDDELADDMPETFDIEFIETGDDEFETSMIDIEDENLMAFDDDFEEIDVNFEEDSTIEDIISDDIVDSGFDTDIF